MEYQGVCEVGLERTMNQDAIFMGANGDTGLFCVADGMGGHSHGERASREIVDGLEQWWEGFQASAYDYDFSRMIYALNQVLEKANRNIYKMAGSGQICGSTAVVLFVYRGRYGILSAGDSRIYLCDRSRVRQLTVDEVWENQVNLRLSNRVKKQHPNWGKLVNAIGIAEDVRITSSTDQGREGMMFMLCSDGLYKMLPERLLHSYLRKSRRDSLAVTVSRMMGKVYDNGAKDNVSVVLVRV